MSGVCYDVWRCSEYATFEFFFHFSSYVHPSWEMLLSRSSVDYAVTPLSLKAPSLSWSIYFQRLKKQLTVFSSRICWRLALLPLLVSQCTSAALLSSEAVLSTCQLIMSLFVYVLYSFMAALMSFTLYVKLTEIDPILLFIDLHFKADLHSE